MARDDHRAHLPDVLRDVDRVHPDLPGPQGERPQKPHHRREPAAFPLLQLDRVVPAQGEQPLQLRAVGTGHFVEDVPGGDPERFLAEEVLVQIGRLVVGETQKPFVHDGKRVGHGPSATSDTRTVTVVSGRHSSGTAICGRSTVAGSSTSSGITP